MPRVQAARRTTLVTLRPVAADNIAARPQPLPVVPRNAWPVRAARHAVYAEEASDDLPLWQQSTGEELETLDFRPDYLMEFDDLDHRQP